LRVSEEAGAYLRRRAMMATMSCATPISRAARAIRDGSFGPSHRHQEVEKRGVTVAVKSTLPSASGVG